MRPNTFQQQLLAALATAGVSARAADGPEGSGMACGIIADEPWQIIGRLAPGDRHGNPAPAPVTGTAPTEQNMPEQPASGRAHMEAALAACVTRMEGRDQVATVERYSTREKPPVVGYGLHVEFHDGSAVFVQLKVRAGSAERKALQAV